MTAIWLATAAILGWLAKDLSGRLLDRFVARSGRIGYALRECGFFCETVAEDGRKLISRYYPDNMFVDERVHYLRCSGDLYNDSDVSILLTKPSVVFWGPEGFVIRHSNPRLTVNAEEPSVITVPAHGRTPITVTMPIFREDLDDKYASTLPILYMRDVSGKKHEFRLASTSFHGDLAAWPRKGELPVRLLHGSEEAVETDEPKLPGSATPRLRKEVNLQLPGMVSNAEVSSLERENGSSGECDD